MRVEHPPMNSPKPLDMIVNLAEQRRSVRQFQPDPVPTETIRRILEVTLATPSNCNVQPWHIHLVSGLALKCWSSALISEVEAGVTPDHEIAEAGSYTGIFRERQIDAAKRLFAAQGIARDDMVGRMRSLLRNYTFFGAPHVALFCVPHWAGSREIADCGQAMQSFMLTATAAGLGSCPQGSLGGYCRITRQVLAIADDQLILAGISFGFTDESHQTAGVRPPRCAVEDLVRFHH